MVCERRVSRNNPLLSDADLNGQDFLSRHRSAEIVALPLQPPAASA
jgi:hypothetical protein